MRTAAGCVALFLTLASTVEAGTSARAVRFVTDRTGAIIIDARVNGTGPYRFLLDTGSARSVVSATLRTRLNAPLVSRTRVVSAGMDEWAAMARLGSISIGAASAPDVDAIVLADRRLERVAGAIDGIVGQDFLSRFNYLVDRDRRLLLWNPAPAERLERGTPLRLVATEGRYLVELPQESGDGLMMVPDSGADTLVFFSTSRASRLPMRPTGGDVTIASLAGNRSARRVQLARLAIGDEVLRHEPAVMVTNADAGSDGLLPLRAYRQVLFDNGAKTVTLWR